MLSKTIVVSVFSALVGASFVLVTSSLHTNHLGNGVSSSLSLPGSASWFDDQKVNSQMFRITVKPFSNRKLQNFISLSSRSPINGPLPDDNDVPDSFSTADLLLRQVNKRVKDVHLSQLMSVIPDLFQSVMSLNVDKDSSPLVSSIDELRKHLPFLDGAFRELVEISSCDPEEREKMTRTFDLILSKVPEILNCLMLVSDTIRSVNDSSDGSAIPLTCMTFPDLDETFDGIAQIELSILPFLESKVPDIIKDYPAGKRALMHVFTFIQLCVCAIKLQ